MAQLHATKLSSKDRDLRDKANKIIADRKKSHIVSVFISCFLYIVGTCHSLPLPLSFPFAIAIATPIFIAIPTDISIYIVIDYLLFNTTLTDYNWKFRTTAEILAYNPGSAVGCV